MKKLKPRSIRTNLVLLVFLVLLPLFSILVYSSYKQKQQAISFVDQNVKSLSNTISIQIKLVENNFNQTLSILSQLRDIDEPNSEKTNNLLKNLILQNPSFASLLIVNNKGELIASDKGYTSLNVSDRKYFKDAISTKKFSVGEFVRGRLSHKPVIHFAYPVLGEKDSIKYILVASFDLKYYSQIFDAFALSEKSELILVDNKGVILYNYPEIQAEIGQKLTPKLYEHFVNDSSGYIFKSANSDSITRIYALNKLRLKGESPYITVLVGIPQNKAISVFYKTLTKYALFWIFAGILIIIMAYIFAVRAIVKPLDKLVMTSRKIADGNLQFELEEPTSSKEINTLFKAVSEMTKKLQQRETEKNMALKDLKKLKERFEIAINSAKIGIWDWHIRNNKLIWDKNMYNLFHINSDIVSFQLDDWKKQIFLPDLPKFNRLIENAINDCRPFRDEFRIQLANNDIKFLRIFGNVIFDKENKPVRLIGVCWDITERKNLELKLNEEKFKAETSDKLKSTFLANVSHEFRTPLHGIIGFAQILKSNEIPHKEKLQYLDIIIQSGNKLQNIISNIIDVSLLDANQLKLNFNLCDIRLLMDDIYKKFINIKIEEQKSFQFLLEEPSETKTVYNLDEYRLRQVILNLVDNAFKFTEKGEIRIGYLIQNNQIEFYVKDTGIGIKTENSDIIFDRFKQIDHGLNRNYSGNGLGLTICKGLVELMGGNIWFDSNSSGSTFKFIIPVSTEMNVTGIDQNINSDYLLN